MAKVDFKKPAKERNSSENLTRLSDYIRWFLNDPEIAKHLSKERQEDINETLNTFIGQYNTMLQDNKRLKSTDSQLVRLEKVLRCIRLC